MRVEQSGTPARQFIDYLGTVPASYSLLKNKTKVLNWRKDFLSVGTCVSICPKGRSYKAVHRGAFEICKKRVRVLATVCRWVCQGGGLQMGLQQHCMSGGGAPMGSKLEASLQPVSLFPQQFCICRVFLCTHRCLCEVWGPLSVCEWEDLCSLLALSHPQCIQGPVAPQCGLQSPLRNGPQNLFSLLATLTHNSHLSIHICLCWFYISMPLHTVPPKLSYCLPLLVHSTLS